WAWYTRGSISASNSPLVTASPISTWIFLTCPDTWVPTSTYCFASSLPCAVTTSSIVPRVMAMGRRESLWGFCAAAYQKQPPATKLATTKRAITLLRCVVGRLTCDFIVVYLLLVLT